MSILVIDNYDSFTYNLVQYAAELSGDILIYRNDELSLDDIHQLQPEKIIISPGPCTPNKAGLSMHIIKEFGATIPLLGVCLGHQCIGQVFGGHIIRATKPMHGKISWIQHDGSPLFQGIDSPMQVTRYHSLVIDPQTLPDCLQVTAWSQDDQSIMAIQHTAYPIYGVQFHPESILTLDGKKLLANFLAL